MTSSTAAIAPFRVAIEQQEIDDLRARLAHARWPATDLPDTGWRRGVPRAYLRDWSSTGALTSTGAAQEAQLNALPQFSTEIDGLTVHFLHVRSPEPNALPLIVTHGYPGSIAEFLRIVGPLTDPRAHGGDQADAFHVVAPSLPGFGFSTPVRAAGWESERTARAWVELMRRLGYERYGAHGGDIGAGVSESVAGLVPERVVALHVWYQVFDGLLAGVVHDYSVFA